MLKSLNEFEIWPERPLVSMATDRVTVEKRRHHVSRTFLIGFISYLQLMMIYIRA